MSVPLLVASVSFTSSFRSYITSMSHSHLFHNGSSDFGGDLASALLLPFSTGVDSCLSFGDGSVFFLALAVPSLAATEIDGIGTGGAGTVGIDAGANVAVLGSVGVDTLLTRCFGGVMFNGAGVSTSEYTEGESESYSISDWAEDGWSSEAEVDGTSSIGDENHMPKRSVAGGAVDSTEGTVAT